GQMTAVGALPTSGALTFVVVGRAGAGNNGVLVGSEAVASGAEGTLILHSNSNGSTKFQIEYPTNDRRNATSPGWYYADGPNICVGSHNPAADEMALRINRGEYETTDMAGVSTANGNSTLTVGGAGPAGGSFGKMEGGDIAEIMIFTVALHQDATLLAAVEAYLGDRYGIAAP
ncbi:hypothetical protein KUW09_25130, partial [Mameliella alba]|nr:hypothetical protein [Antarctobacter heliothermus]MBY6147345.1 hypothetical protein [Mameliella alba]